MLAVIVGVQTSMLTHVHKLNQHDHKNPLLISCYNFIVPNKVNLDPFIFIV